MSFADWSRRTSTPTVSGKKSLLVHLVHDGRLSVDVLPWASPLLLDGLRLVREGNP